MTKRISLMSAIYKWCMVDILAHSMGLSLGVNNSELLDKIDNDSCYEALHALVYCYTFLDPKRNTMLKEYVDAYEVYLTLKTYTLGELKLLVFTHHGIPPSKPNHGKLYWVLAYLECRKVI